MQKIGYIFIVSAAKYPTMGSQRIRSSITPQVCPVVKTDMGHSAITYKEGTFLPSKHMVVFARDCKQLGYIGDDCAKEEYKAFKAQSASQRGAYGGLIMSAVSYAIGEALTDATDVRGFYAFFLNDKEVQQNFAGVGKADLIERIVISAPSSH